ncbi:hypothetical protein [Spiroplasma endosymbiont of Polydrusus pterygomalis]|uniref:hypothetical protein n=1 Tax=Spiroplasma endosymbiont of Polydrusus pterygomalis TaxID=3139327 RepID=UPI003CCB1853
MPVWEIVLLVIALLFAMVSIGIWIWNVNAAKKLRNQQENSSTRFSNKPQKFPFKLQNFILDLGGIDNIKATTATVNKIKVEVNDHSKINFDNLKKIKNRGILDQNDSVSLVLGIYCNSLSTAINDLIKMNNEK